MATIVGSLVGSYAKKLQEIITEEAIVILGAKEELKELHETREQIRCFLSDADRRDTQDSSIHNWYSRLKDAMYDADDSIDLASLEGNKLLHDHYCSSRISTACSGFSPLSCFSIRVRHELVKKNQKPEQKIRENSK